MEIFPALLAVWAGKSPVTGEIPAQRPVRRSFDDFFDLRLNTRLSKLWWGWWFETPSRPLWRHSNDKIFAQGPLQLVIDSSPNDMLLTVFLTVNLALAGILLLYHPWVCLLILFYFTSLTLSDYFAFPIDSGTYTSLWYNFIMPLVYESWLTWLLCGRAANWRKQSAVASQLWRKISQSLEHIIIILAQTAYDAFMSLDY